MAHHKSALKRIRQNEKRRLRNKHIKSGARGQVKKLREAVASKDPEQAASALKVVIGTLNRAASKGVLPKPRVSRHISRLTLLVNKMA